MWAGVCESVSWGACWNREFCTASSMAGLLTLLEPLDAISTLLRLGLSFLCQHKALAHSCAATRALVSALGHAHAKLPLLIL